MAHVLLVDDCGPIRSALSRYLTLHRHTVTDVSSAREALERVGPDVDVVVTDLTMPGMGGAELLRALGDRGVTAPVILMSGRLPYPDEAAGAAFVLQKPFGPEKLCEAIDRALTGVKRERVAAGAPIS